MTTVPCVTVRIEPRGGVAVRADWFGFAAATQGGSSRESMTFRLACCCPPRPGAASTAALPGSGSPAAASTALFTSSGCVVTVEGPATVVQKCLPLTFFERDTTSSRSLAAATSSDSSEQAAVGGTAAWPLWRRQVFQLHSVLHEQRLAAFSDKAAAARQHGGADAADGGEGGGEDDDLDSVGPRLLVCGSRPASGRTTICKMLLNLAARDGFHPLFIAADPTGTSIVGQPGCYAACFADAGVDPTEGGALFPCVQVPLPLEDCPRNQLAEPARHAIAALLDYADRRTVAVRSCRAAGLLVDTDVADELLLEDELERLVALIEECAIDTVIVVGSEHLRQALRFRLQRSKTEQAALLSAGNYAADNNSGGGNNNSGGGGGFMMPKPMMFGGAGDEAVSAASRREELAKTVLRCSDAVMRVARPDGSEVALHGCAVVDGAEDHGSAGVSAGATTVSSAAAATALATRQALWAQYFFGTGTTPLSAFALSVPAAAARFVVLRSQASGAGAGLAPLQAAGEESVSLFKATAQQVLDLPARFAAHCSAGATTAGAAAKKLAQQSAPSGTRPMIAAVLRLPPGTNVEAYLDGEMLCRAPVHGFVAITNVAAAGEIELLSPSKALPANCVFALLHATAQA